MWVSIILLHIGWDGAVAALLLAIAIMVDGWVEVWSGGKLFSAIGSKGDERLLKYNKFTAATFGDSDWGPNRIVLWFFEVMTLGGLLARNSETEERELLKLKDLQNSCRFV